MNYILTEDLQMGIMINQIRKIIIYFLISTITFSCSKQDDLKPKDCNCNRVVESNSFNLPGGITFGTYWTINDCSGLKSSGQWSNIRPQNGVCNPK